MKKKSVINILLIALLVQACSAKNEKSGSDLSSLSSGQIPIIGGSTTKEIIIRTNLARTNSGNLISANSYSDSSYQVSVEEKSIYSKINQERKNQLKNVVNDPRYQKSDLIFDLASGGATILSLPFGPLATAVTTTAVTSSTNALKGYVQEYQRSEYERVLENLHNRKDAQVLKLAYIISRKLGHGTFNDVVVGTSPYVIKEKVASFQKELLNNSELSVKDLDQFLKYGNDNILLGLTLGMLSNQIKVKGSVDSAGRELNETKQLIQSIAESTKNLLENQQEFFQEIDKRMTPEEKETFLKNLVTGKSENATIAISGLRNLDNEHSKAILEIAAKLEKSHAVLKVSTQIASDLNVNPEIIRTVNHASSVVDATKSLLAFSVTGNPLDALNSIASITSLFSKPKPDPRFTAIFENFKDIKISLNVIQNQLNDINSRLDNVEDGLSAILDHERLNSELIVKRTSRELKYCVSMIEKMQNIAEEKITYDFILSEFDSGKNGNYEDINSCFLFLRETFIVSPEYNHDVLSAKVFQDVLTEEAEVKKVFNVSSQMAAVYESLYPFYSEKLPEGRYEPRNLLSPTAVVFNSDILLKTAFLFDFAKYDVNRKLYSIVDRSSIEETIRKNQLSQVLLESALNYVNTALVQQNIIDGTKLNEQVLSRFLKGQANCFNSRFNDLECRLVLNPVMRENLLIQAFRKIVGSDYFWAWSQVASDNPDFLNEKLESTSLKVFWVGEGASKLFKGIVLPKKAGLKSGPYVQLKYAPELMIALPDLRKIKDKDSVLVSARTQRLYDYKTLLENELMERNLDKVLSKSELSVYNAGKIKMVLKK